MFRNVSGGLNSKQATNLHLFLWGFDVAVTLIGTGNGERQMAFMSLDGPTGNFTWLYLMIVFRLNFAPNPIVNGCIRRMSNLDV